MSHVWLCARTISLLSDRRGHRSAVKEEVWLLTTHWLNGWNGWQTCGFIIVCEIYECEIYFSVEDTITEEQKNNVISAFICAFIYNSGEHKRSWTPTHSNTLQLHFTTCTSLQHLVEYVRPFEGRYSAETGPILMIHTSKDTYSSRRKRLAWSLCLILMRLVLVFNERFGIELVVKVEK